jgi:hypothetical protein
VYVSKLKNAISKKTPRGKPLEKGLASKAGAKIETYFQSPKLLATSFQKYLSNLCLGFDSQHFPPFCPSLIIAIMHEGAFFRRKGYKDRSFSRDQQNIFPIILVKKYNFPKCLLYSIQHAFLKT